MANAFSEATCVYGAQIINKHLTAIAAEVDGVRAAEDIEYIHRMRVATRRMRSALVLFGECIPKQEYKTISREVGKVTRALGEARDLDVQLEVLKEAAVQFNTPRFSPGIRRLDLRLSQRRNEAQAHVNAAMDLMIEDRLLERIGKWAAPLLSNADSVYLYSPALYQLAFGGVKTRLDDLLTHVPFIYDPQNTSELHAMRISAKRLRYTLEAFEDLYGPQIKPYISVTRKLQDLLGTLHDLDVWIAYIPEFIEEERGRIWGYFGNDRPLKRLIPGLEAFKLSRIAIRQDTYADFIQEWDGIEQAETWEKLLRLINTPLDLEAAMRTLRTAQMPSKVGPAPDVNTPASGSASEAPVSETQD
ncbi:MAG: CHAD domain-containing protein [Anaerolineaceae bacterium]